MTRHRSSPLAQVVRQLGFQSGRRASPGAMLRLAVLLGIYLLVAAGLNHWLGWNLPGWRDLVDSGQQVATEPAGRPAQRHTDLERSSPPPENAATSADHVAQDNAAAVAADPRPDVEQREATAARPSDPLVDAILAGRSDATYESPGGLAYRRGSQQGHRLRHVMAHARDQPQRPGSHGVFDASDPDEVIAVIDEAYRRAGRDSRTDVRREGDRTVYDVDLGRRIGYVGGQSGHRSGLPAARKLRLVLEGERVITAFPIR